MTVSKPLWSVETIDHVGIVVRDLDAAQRHFLHNFGLVVTHDEVVPEASARLVHLDTLTPGATSLQLVQPVGPGKIADFLAQNGDGLHHICFAVDEIAPILNQIPCESETRTFQGGKGRLACFLAKPASGVLIELAELRDNSEFARHELSPSSGMQGPPS